MNTNKITVFYSWQSDTPGAENRELIEEALQSAIQQVAADGTLEPALRDNGIELDKDIAGVGGSPPITQTILDKIKACAVFVADLTFVGESLKPLGRTRKSKRLLPNPNVLLEYGYALHSRGHERMIAVMNVAYGEPGNENLPFDVRHVRWPITYHLTPSESEERETVLKEVTEKLVERLRLILQTMTPSQQRFLPHPTTTDPSSFFTSAEELVPDRIFGRPADISTVPNQGRAYLRLYPSIVVPIFESELETRNLASKGNLRPMGMEYQGWSHSRNAFGAIAYASPSEGRLYRFTELFLTREIWGVDAFAINEERCIEFMEGKLKTGFIMTSYVERMFVETLFNYLQFIRCFLHLPPPIHIEAGLVGVNGYPIAVDRGVAGKFLEDKITWQSTIQSLDIKAHEVLRPFFERFWNKAGVPRPPDFDSRIVKYHGPFPT